LGHSILYLSDAIYNSIIFRSSFLLLVRVCIPRMPQSQVDCFDPLIGEVWRWKTDRLEIRWRSGKWLGLVFSFKESLDSWLLEISAN